MKDLLLNIYNFVFRRALYVIADERDSSITMSKRLCKHIDVFKLNAAKVFVFAVPERRTYGFTVNPTLEQETQLADIQYNAKYKCIGFETLNPTVARIVWDYGIGVKSAFNGNRVKLSVKVRRTKQGMVYYEILRPHEKSSRNV